MNQQKQIVKPMLPKKKLLPYLRRPIKRAALFHRKGSRNS
jgi:hypothetical protein